LDPGSPDALLVVLVAAALTVVGMAGLGARRR
jgi:hypothetical protein